MLIFEKLKEDCENGLSSIQIALKNNCSQTNVQYWLKKFGLKTLRANRDRQNGVYKRPLKEHNANCLFCDKKFLSKDNGISNKYCSNKCQAEYQSKLKYDEYYQKFLKGEFVHSKWIRRFLIQIHGRKCNCCKLSLWLNQPIVLWVDHIDGNAGNRNPDNFQLICLNCDALQPTFGAKNLGKGRKSRGLDPSGLEI